MRRIFMVTIVSLLTVAALASSASLASAAEPWWHLTAGSRPTNLAPESEGEIVSNAVNVGDAGIDGAKTPVTVTDTLPAGLEAIAIGGGSTNGGNSMNPMTCSLSKLTCVYNLEPGEGNPNIPAVHPLEPYMQLEMRIRVRVLPGASSSEVNQVSVTGGGAPLVAVSRALRVSEETTGYGIEDYEFNAEDEGGALDTQAGSHPYQVTGTFIFNQGPDLHIGSDTYPQTEPGREEAHPEVIPAGLSKDVFGKLPPGLLGNPSPVPKCSLGTFLTSPAVEEENECPQQTAVGVAMVTIQDTHAAGRLIFPETIYNLEPYAGEPARFGFSIPIAGVYITLDTSVRSGPGEDYGVTISSPNIPQTAGLDEVQLIFWGVPGSPAHNSARGEQCILEGYLSSHKPCVPSEAQYPPSLLTMPTSCDGPLQSSLETDSWTDRGTFLQVPTAEPLQSLKGCNRLPFSPIVSAEATTDRASAPSGLDFNLDFKDEGLTSAEGLAQSQLKETVVTLPEGLTINPSAGVGLGGCTPADYARETVNSPAGAGCPNDSKLGTVEIETPLLTQKIHGSIFIAQPYENPFKSLVALYVVAKEPETGILIKLPGKVTPNPLTGQLMTTFENNPQLAFNHFNFHFREGQQAPLISPPICGTYTTNAVLTPWSEPLAPVTETSSFSITKGYDGGACPSGGVPPFKPGIESGLINNNAGAYSSFYLHLTRTDAEQEISGFSTNLPSGLTGNLSGIPFCPEANIEAARHKTGAQEEAAPSCSAASQIGRSLVGTGVGAVLAYVPGKIYLAGPFHGAPFSIVSVTSAVVGPFDLGTVVLRFGLAIDPTTARVNVTPTSSEPIPTIIDGIVTHVRDIRVYIDRPNFILNPTTCNPETISSTLNSPIGASSTVTSPFQSASCQTLKFEPKFVVSTSGKTSRSEGASLHVKLSYPSGALGKDTNIAKVKVDLPRQLPSRLSTLQKACTDAQFETNPAGCPAESRVGEAKAITPLIPVPLEGPAYFVSHGGAKFPELIIVLQGYGVTIDLHGETFINKEGITSSTFEAVPDQPIGSFELTLPEGKYSALAANGNLCKSTLAMPTSFVAQNGAEIHKSTPIGVTGCKPSVNIVRHSVKGATVTIAASVPSAGKLVASGPGLSHASKRIGKAGTLSFSLKLSGREQALLKSHPGRKLAVAIKLQFTPTHGKKLTAGMTVNVG